MCFYEDTVLAIFIWFLLRYVGKGVIPDHQVSILNVYTASTFIHGLAHIAMAYTFMTDPDTVTGRVVVK